MIKRYFGDRGFWRVAMRLAIPIALQNLLVSSFTLVDTLMVGQLGDHALSSVGMAGQWSWLLNIAMFGIISGTSLYISQYWGVRDMDGIYRTYGIALSSAVLVSLVFFGFGLGCSEQILWIFNKQPHIIASGSAYLRIACWSYPAVALFNIFSVVLRTTEQVKLPLAVSSVTTVLNAVFNYGLIFGKLGMPEMGVEGAALATCISAWSGPLLLLVISLLRRNVLVASPRKVFHFNKTHVATFYRKATPIIANESMWGLGTLLYQVIFSNLGDEYYAAVTIHKTFENIAFAFFIGLCNACCIMVGKSVGSGRIRRAVDDARRFMLLVPMVSAVVGALIILFRVPLVSLFNFQDNISDLTAQTAQTILMIYALDLPVRNMPYITIVGIFRPGGDTATAAKYDLLTLWGLSLPCTFLAAYVLRLPFVAVYAIMYLMEDYLKTYLCVRHFRSGRWIRPVTDEGRAGLAAYGQNAKGPT